MDSYVLIETRDPFESADAHRCYGLAGALADSGAEVTVFLVQNGVLPVRRGAAAAQELAGLAGRASVVADDFSLRERAIGQDDLAPGITTGGIDDLVDAVMTDSRKVLWF